MVVPSARDPSEEASPNSIDAIFILGRCASGLVLEGSRQGIKSWTSYGLVYRDKLCSGILAACCQWFTRVGTMGVVLFIFSTVPNGSTTDQVAFIVLNILGQLNTLIGLRLNARHCLSRLKMVERHVGVRYRLNISGFLIRNFKSLEDKYWVDKAGLIPNTSVWMQWGEEVVKDNVQDPKQLYNQIASAQRNEKAVRAETDHSAYDYRWQQ